MVSSLKFLDGFDDTLRNTAIKGSDVQTHLLQYLLQVKGAYLAYLNNRLKRKTPGSRTKFTFKLNDPSIFKLDIFLKRFDLGLILVISRAGGKKLKRDEEKNEDGSNFKKLFEIQSTITFFYSSKVTMFFVRQRHPL